MQSRKSSLARLCAFCAVSMWSTVSFAQLIPDGGFELSPVPAFSASWTGAGDAGVVVSPLAVWSATEGAQFAVMTTAPAIDPPAGFGDPIPGLPLFGGSIPSPDLELALAMPAGSLAGTVEGSGILSEPFATLPGQTLLFDAFFATNEPPPGFLPFPDTAFVSIDGGPPIPFYNSDAGPIFPSGSPLYFVGDSGAWFTLGAALPPGPHTIAFGVVDVGDGDVSSGLFIDNVRLDPAIPEPSSFALVGISLAGFAFAARRKLRRAKCR
jgi:hypothetical protein